MKSVTYWYQFFTAREELVPILHDVKFTKCEICGSTRLEISYLGSRGIVLSKALIRFAVTAKLICVFVFAYAKNGLLN